MFAEFGVAFRFSERGQQDQHIAAFFNGHLVVFSLFASAIDLPIRQRIGAEIMRRERKSPAWRFGVIENRLQHPLQQRRAKQ
jgi:hypothetical protein